MQVYWKLVLGKVLTSLKVDVDNFISENEVIMVQSIFHSLERPFDPMPKPSSLFQIFSYTFLAYRVQLSIMSIITSLKGAQCAL